MSGKSPPVSGIPLATTERLTVHRLELSDAQFICRLLNEPDFIQFIGDKGVRNLQDAGTYLEEGPLADYVDRGYGAYLVRQRDTGEPIGLCGFYQRSNLDCPDLGFAFSRPFWGQGYALEAARALLDYARDTLELSCLAALAGVENRRSVRLIEALGFTSVGYFKLPDEDEVLRLYRLRF